MKLWEQDQAKQILVQLECLNRHVQLIADYVSKLSAPNVVNDGDGYGQLATKATDLESYATHVSSSRTIEGFIGE